MYIDGILWEWTRLSLLPFELLASLPASWLLFSTGDEIVCLNQINFDNE